MKASELAKLINEEIYKYGDCDVCILLENDLGKKNHRVEKLSDDILVSIGFINKSDLDNLSLELQIRLRPKQ